MQVFPCSAGFRRVNCTFLESIYIRENVGIWFICVHGRAKGLFQQNLHFFVFVQGFFPHFEQKLQKRPFPVGIREKVTSKTPIRIEFYMSVRRCISIFMKRKFLVLCPDRYRIQSSLCHVHTML